MRPQHLQPVDVARHDSPATIAITTLPVDEPLIVLRPTREDLQHLAQRIDDSSRELQPVQLLYHCSFVDFSGDCTVVTRTSCLAVHVSAQTVSIEVAGDVWLTSTVTELPENLADHDDCLLAVITEYDTAADITTCLDNGTALVTAAPVRRD